MARGGWLGVVFCCAAVFFGARDPMRAQEGTAGHQNACSADLVKNLAGAWKAPQYRMKRASEVGIQVFGPNAFDVRDVELTLQPSGEGVLKISTSVLDQKGKTWAPTLIEARMSARLVQMSARPSPLPSRALVSKRSGAICAWPRSPVS